MSLYFIALVPQIGLREQIEAFKKEIEARYQAKHALKLPAHITLKIPFNIRKEEEPLLLKSLQELADRITAFDDELSGFDYFKSGVIFVKCADHDPIIEVHNQLEQVFNQKLGVNKNEDPSRFYPHMTIASRDLSADSFSKAWAEFKNREFQASFEAESFFLFKHNGKTWDVLRKFFFIPKIEFD
jgi:2'-5' RNA ligase